MTSILWPLVNNVIRRNKLSNTYGRFAERTSGVHWGWDFYAEVGTPCYAIADGKLVLKYGSASDTGSFGLVSVLEFSFEGQQLYAAYCHLSGVNAPLGAISAGEQIGFTGNSGNAQSMRGLDQHLHFEIRTQPRPPPGGTPHRLSPLVVFKRCPLNQVIFEP
jgi:murein DD-endopeptidase MepM/ murein hydrolase activator NlpD